jgi:Flp pilus assembly pilin Flp
MKQHLVHFLADERGEDLIEYGLLAAFVAGIATAVIIADPLGIKGALEGAYQKAKDALDDAGAP